MSRERNVFLNSLEVRKNQANNTLLSRLGAFKPSGTQTKKQPFETAQPCTDLKRDPNLLL